MLGLEVLELLEERLVGEALLCEVLTQLRLDRSGLAELVQLPGAAQGIPQLVLGLTPCLTGALGLFPGLGEGPAGALQLSPSARQRVL